MVEKFKDSSKLLMVLLLNQFPHELFYFILLSNLLQVGDSNSDGVFRISCCYRRMNVHIVYKFKLLLLSPLDFWCGLTQGQTLFFIWKRIILNMWFSAITDHLKLVSVCVKRCRKNIKERKYKKTISNCSKLTRIVFCYLKKWISSINTFYKSNAKGNNQFKRNGKSFQILKKRNR